jgi:hypothetical protein
VQSEKPKIGLKLWWFFALIAFAICGFFLLSLVMVYPEEVEGVGLLLLKGEIGQILSPDSGTLESWFKEEGDAVKKGEAVAKLIDEQEEMTVVAANDGIIAEITAYANSRVLKGDTLAIVTSHGDVRKDLELIGFVSSLEGKKIAPGMKALVNPSVSDKYRAGSLKAIVKRVGKLPMSKASVQSLIKIPEVAKYIGSQIEAEPFVVYLSLMPDEKNITGYQWDGPGPRFTLDSGTYAEIFITYNEPTFFELLWPSINRWRLK